MPNFEKVSPVKYPRTSFFSRSSASMGWAFCDSATNCSHSRVWKTVRSAKLSRRFQSADLMSMGWNFILFPALSAKSAAPSQAARVMRRGTVTGKSPHQQIPSYFRAPSGRRVLSR